MEFIKLDEMAYTPERATDGSAGYDLYSTEHVMIEPGVTHLVSTSLALAITPGLVGLIFPRSGLATKYGLTLANSVGVIDSDYRGEIKVALRNSSDTCREIKAGDRVAQIVFIPYEAPELIEVTELTHTARGSGGFGSTGKN